MAILDAQRGRHIALEHMENPVAQWRHEHQSHFNRFAHSHDHGDAAGAGDASAALLRAESSGGPGDSGVSNLSKSCLDDSAAIEAMAAAALSCAADTPCAVSNVHRGRQTGHRASKK